MKRNPDVVFICLKGLLPGPSHAVQQLPLHLLRKQLFTRSRLPTAQRRAARDTQVCSTTQQLVALSASLGSGWSPFPQLERLYRSQCDNTAPCATQHLPNTSHILRWQKQGLAGSQRENSFCVNIHWPVLLNSRPGTGPCLAGEGLGGYSRLRFYSFFLFFPSWHLAPLSSSAFHFPFAMSILPGNLLAALLPWMSSSSAILFTSVQSFFLFLLNQSTTPNNPVKYNLLSLFSTKRFWIFICNALYKNKKPCPVLIA